MYILLSIVKHVMVRYVCNCMDVLLCNINCVLSYVMVCHGIL